MATATVIPLDQSVPWYSFQMALDAATYTFEVAFNTRAGYWTLSLYDVAGNLLLGSIPLLIQRNLTAPYHTLNIPKGDFLCLDDADDGSQPGLGSFLLDHTLYYVVN